MQYTVRAAAIATGVSEDRLRTWERRYGIPEPPRSATGRRLYGEDDLQVIRRMAELVDAGMNAQAAARAVRSGSTGLEPAPPVEVDADVARLVDATGALDGDTLMDLLLAAGRRLGLAGALEEVALPALVEAGWRWERGQVTVPQEHLLSEAVRAWVGREAGALPRPAPDAPRVLLACPEDERHDLGALTLATLLRATGLRVTYLGADVPTAALIDAARRTRFDAVCLSVTSVSALPVARLACSGLLAVRRSMRLYVGGRAVPPTDEVGSVSLPAVRLPTSLTAAVRLIADHLAGDAPAPGAPASPAPSTSVDEGARP